MVRKGGVGRANRRPAAAGRSPASAENPCCCLRDPAEKMAATPRRDAPSPTRHVAHSHMVDIQSHIFFLLFFINQQIIQNHMTCLIKFTKNISLTKLTQVGQNKKCDCKRVLVA